MNRAKLYFFRQTWHYVTDETEATRVPLIFLHELFFLRTVSRFLFGLESILLKRDEL